MDLGDEYPVYLTDESVKSSSTDGEEVAEIIGTVEEVAEESDTEVVASGTTLKQGTLDSTKTSLDGSTLMFLQKDGRNSGERC